MSASSTLLLLERDAAFAHRLATLAERRHYATHVVPDASLARQQLETTRYAVAILDGRTPEPDGVGLCLRLRAQGHAVPILVLASEDSVTERVTALDAGADDCVARDADESELMARIAKLTALPAGPARTVIHAGSLSLNVVTRVAAWEGNTAELTMRECALLRELMSAPNKLVARQALLSSVWGKRPAEASNLVDVYVRTLRHKLHIPAMQGDRAELALESVRGVGYRLMPGSATIAVSRQR